MKLKTEIEVKNSMEQLRSRALKLDKKKDTSETKSIIEDLAFREECLLYLRTNPDVGYVSRIKDSLKTRISDIEANAHHFHKKDLPKLKRQLRIHSYILD